MTEHWASLILHSMDQAYRQLYLPGKLQAFLLNWMIKHGTGIKLDHDILPFCCQDDIIGTNHAASSIEHLGHWRKQVMHKLENAMNDCVMKKMMLTLVPS